MIFGCRPDSFSYFRPDYAVLFYKQISMQEQKVLSQSFQLLQNGDRPFKTPHIKLRWGLSFFQQNFCNGLKLHIGSSFVNFSDFRVSVELLYRVLFYISVTAKQVDCLGTEVFRHL